MGAVTTRNGLLYEDGKVIDLPRADTVAMNAGFHCAEQMVKGLEKRNMKDMATLADELYNAKKAEDVAKAQRISIEEEIAELIETGDNGSKTVTASEHFKVTVKRALRYAADMDAIMQMKLPEGVAPLKVIPPQPEMIEFDAKAYEGLREKDPATFAQIAAHVTATPAKVSVTLKLA